MSVCLVPGCPTLVAKGSRCPIHQLPSRGRPHRRASQHVMSATNCAVCGDPFTPRNPPTRGHIIGLQHGGQNVPSNYQAECAQCNYGGHRA